MPGGPRAKSARGVRWDQAREGRMERSVRLAAASAASRLAGEHVLADGLPEARPALFALDAQGRARVGDKHEA